MQKTLPGFRGTRQPLLAALGGVGLQNEQWSLFSPGFSPHPSPSSPKEANFGLPPISSHQLWGPLPQRWPREHTEQRLETLHSRPPTWLGSGREGGQTVGRNLKSVPGSGAARKGFGEWEAGCIFQRLIGRWGMAARAAPTDVQPGAPGETHVLYHDRLREPPGKVGLA